MHIRPAQLAKHLTRGLRPVYVVHGDEPLQREEALDTIRAAARDAGFAERIVLHADGSFDWNELRTHAASLSLFSDRKLIDLRLPGGAPGKDGGAALAAFAADPAPDMTLLLSCGRLDRRATSTKWFKALDAAGDSVEVRRVGIGDLPRWIVDRAAARGLAVVRDAAEMLAERNEGNLLACAQEIDKLSLLSDGAAVTLEDVMKSVSDSSRFGAFDLVDAALEGSGVRSVRILRTLRDEGVEPILILGSLTWAIRGAAGIAAGVESGNRLDDVIRGGFGAWWGRKPALERALARMPRARWVAVLDAAEGVDRILKGAPTRSGVGIRWSRSDAWDGLERLCLAICGVKLPQTTLYN